MAETRKLAAIMVVDVVGYSRLMGEDEAGTAKVVREHRDAARPFVSDRGGRIVKTMGDGLLLEFPSVVDAVECAAAIQRLMLERNAETPESKRIVYRVGVHLGDVLIDGDDILGEGVNIAARLEGICEPGGVLISGSAYEHVRGRVEASFVDLGEQDLKNIARPVRAYRVAIDGSAAAGAPPKLPVKVGNRDRLSIAVLPFQNMSGDPEQDYFADGISEDIITALSKLSQLFVIARNSSFSFKGKNVQIREIGKTLGARYVLEGSVRKVDKRVRITAQLIDATNDGHLWAERFDRDLTDIFAVQDDVTGQIVSALSLNLTQGDRRRLMASRPTIWRLSTVFCVAGNSGGGTRKSPTPRRGTCCFAPPNSTRNSRRVSLGWELRISTTMLVNGPTSRRVRSISPMRPPPAQRRSIRNCPPRIGL